MKALLDKRCYSLHHTVDGMRVDGPPSSVSGFTGSIWGDATHLYGDVSNLRGRVSDVKGDATNVCGDVTDIVGDFDQCEITAAERQAGVYVTRLIARSVS